MSTPQPPYGVTTQEGFAEAGPDASAAAAGAGTILDSGQAPSPHAQGWNKPQGETPRSDHNPSLKLMGTQGYPMRGLRFLDFRKLFDNV